MYNYIKLHLKWIQFSSGFEDNFFGPWLWPYGHDSICVGKRYLKIGSTKHQATQKSKPKVHLRILKALTRLGEKGVFSPNGGTVAECETSHFCRLQKSCNALCVAGIGFVPFRCLIKRGKSLFVTRAILLNGFQVRRLSFRSTSKMRYCVVLANRKRSAASCGDKVPMLWQAWCMATCHEN